MAHCTVPTGRSAVRGARILVLVLFFATLLPALKAQELAAGTSEFDAQAFAALPIEKSYAFHKALSESTWQMRRDPDAHPKPGEIAIESGWVVLIKSQASEPLRQAAEDLRAYLDIGMHTRVAVETAASLAEGAKRQGAIVAGTRAGITRLRNLAHRKQRLPDHGDPAQHLWFADTTNWAPCTGSITWKSAWTCGKRPSCRAIWTRPVTACSKRA